MISITNNKQMGGEQELSSSDLFYGVTNSGRSSLRWILESMNLRGKCILVPDFLCQIVIDVLREYEIEITFYSVDEELSYQLNGKETEFDALYVIRYFGYDSGALEQTLSKLHTATIIDDVFGVEPPTINGTQHWCYFNSLRKISFVADFSQVVSNKPLKSIEKKRLDVFSQVKYLAKEQKFSYLNTGQGSEEEYLHQFNLGESILNESKNIYQASDSSIYQATRFCQSLKSETDIRQRNLSLAKKLLKSKQYIDITSQFPSFLPLKLKHRDIVRKALMSKNVFLAVHWPATDKTDNVLTEQLLSIPLDSRYNDRDIERICHLIREITNE